MKNLISKLLTVFVSAVCLMTAQNTFAQGKFDARNAGVEPEIKEAAKFSDLLLRFMTVYVQYDGKRIVSEEEIKELVQLGQSVKDGTSNFRSNLQGLVTKLKNGNRWNEQLDKEFTDSIVSPRAKELFQNSGARKIFGTEINPAINSLGTDIDAMINDLKSRRAASVSQGISFEKAATSRSAAKGRLKCIVLGVGIAVAEVAGAKLTAGNLDKIFDKSCGGGGAAATTE